MFNRRSFLSYTGGTTLTLFTYGKFGVKEAVAQIPGGSLDPGVVPKFATPLLIPPAMPRAGVLFENRKWIDYYEISMKQFSQQILPPGSPATTVWGYGPKSALSPFAPRDASGNLLYNAPSLTIEARANVPVRIKWINELKDGGGNYLPHLLPVDPTLHWANPPGGTAGRDTRPTFASTPAATPAQCQWSPTCTARWASATRATAMPRRGICQLWNKANCPSDTLRKAPGTPSSRTRRRAPER